MKKNNRTELYELNMMPETAEYVHQHERVDESMKSFIQNVDDKIKHKADDLIGSYYTRTQLRTLNTVNVRKILNNPFEKYWNETIEHDMIDGLEKSMVKPVKYDKGERSDAWYAGRSTKRNVPSTSRRSVK